MVCLWLTPNFLYEFITWGLVKNDRHGIRLGANHCLRYGTFFNLQVGPRFIRPPSNPPGIFALHTTRNKCVCDALSPTVTNDPTNMVFYINLYEEELLNRKLHGFGPRTRI